MRRIVCLFFLALGFALGQAAPDALSVMFNGAPSKIKAVTVKDQVFVPVSFPVPEGESEYTVKLRRDSAAHKIEVQQIKVDTRKLRGGEEFKEKCWYCSGTGVCQNDYPGGSGVNTAGLVCPQCNGTSKCYYCAGTGTK